MKRRIGVLTGDDMLYQKIYLIFRESTDFSVMRGDMGADTLLVDAEFVKDTNPSAAGSTDVVYMSRGGEAQLTIPFTEEEILSVLSGDSSGGATLALGKRCAYIHEREIKLTEVEFSLLSALYSAGGFVSREELLRSVWGEGADGGVLNVYVHYLREKLEFAGEKIIISSRKLGYKIDEKYLGGEGANA